jgi:hypothetical protein
MVGPIPTNRLSKNNVLTHCMLCGNKRIMCSLAQRDMDMCSSVWLISDEMFLSNLLDLPSSVRVVGVVGHVDQCIQMIQARMACTQILSSDGVESIALKGSAILALRSVVSLGRIDMPGSAQTCDGTNMHT